jgi:hypothetical protein
MVDLAVLVLRFRMDRTTATMAEEQNHSPRRHFRARHKARSG